MSEKQIWLELTFEGHRGERTVRNWQAIPWVPYAAISIVIQLMRGEKATFKRA